MAYDRRHAPRDSIDRSFAAAMIRSEPHPWLRPLYRRVGVLVVCVVWLAFEVMQQQTFWLILAAAATGYALWEFFLGPTYRTAEDPRDDR